MKFATSLSQTRHSPWHRHLHRRPHCNGSYCYPDLWPGDRQNSHRQRNRALHPYHHRCGCFPWSHLFHPGSHPGLLLAGGCHLSHRHHCGQCAWRTTGHSHCKMFHSLLRYCKFRLGTMNLLAAVFEQRTNVTFCRCVWPWLPNVWLRRTAWWKTWKL